MDARKTLMTGNSEFWAVSIASLFRSFGIGAAWPFFSIYFSDVYNVPVFYIGLIFTASAVLSIVINLAGGALGDFFGRRSAIMVGSVYGIAAYAALAFLTYSGGFLVITITVFIISSASGALIFPASSALVADVTTEAERRRAYSLYRVVSNIGWAAGPLAGALLYDSGMWILLSMLTVTAIIQLAMTALYIQEHRHSNGERMTRKNFMAFDRNLIIFSSGTLFMTIVSSQFLVTLPIFAVNSVHIPSFSIGYIFAVNGLVVIIGQGPLTRLFRRYSDLTMMLAGVVAYSIGYLSVGFSRDLTDLLLSMVVITIGEDLVSPPLSTLIARVAPPGKLARYMAFNSMMNQTARAIGPSIGSFFLSIYAYNGLESWGSIASFGIVSVFILILFGVHLRRDYNAAAPSP
ncbi:MAG: MFS transporter [Candidatus Thermoplasmatota archaeon]|nr:MFS transporter [Candidatus Thermoplasmatota archaeon]MCL5730600.1 MFS transporter [Candidatus Thermoplasmatota archaeon]